MKFIKYLILSTALNLFFFTSPVFAETSDNLRFSLTGGITLGGDEIAGLAYLDGSKKFIHAGEFGYIGAGLEYDMRDDYMLRLNTLYHWDTATAINGDISFSRYVLEVIPYYRLSERYRLGLGLGMHVNTKLSGDFNLNVDFENANAVIASLGRKMKNSDNWLELRMVRVEYSTMTDLNVYSNYTIKPIDGNHIGLAYHMFF